MDQDSGAAADSEFTHANLFGLYLTLSLCVLAQPVGNLISNTPSPEDPVSYNILAWRLNPIACGLEGLFIFIILGKRAIELWLSTELESSLPPNNTRHRFIHWVDGIHVTAISLLIIRADAVDSRGYRIVELLRDNTDDAAIINQLFQPSVLGRSEGWINGVTILSIFAIIIKLGAAVLPWQLRITLLLMVLGWMGVAVLLLLGHLKEFSVGDGPTIARETTLLSTQLPFQAKHTFHSQANPQGSLAGWLLAAPLLPILGYTSYYQVYVAYQVVMLPLMSTLENVIPLGILFLPRLLVMATLCAAVVAILPGYALVMGIPRVFPSTVAHYPPGWLFFAVYFSVYGLYAGLDAILWIYSGSVVLEVFKFLTMCIIMAGQIWFFAYCYLSRSLSIFFRFVNPVVIGLGIPVAFQMYTPEGTFKPPWLDWLG